MLYAGKRWTLQPEQENRVATSEITILRKIEEITKFNPVRNDVIGKTLKQKPITEILENKEVEWYGYFVRMRSDRLVKKSFETRQSKKRKKDRPRKTGLNKIEKIGAGERERGKSLEEIKRLASDRKI